MVDLVLELDHLILELASLRDFGLQLAKLFEELGICDRCRLAGRGRRGIAIALGLDTTRQYCSSQNGCQDETAPDSSHCARPLDNLNLAWEQSEFMARFPAGKELQE